MDAVERVEAAIAARTAHNEDAPFTIAADTLRTILALARSNSWQDIETAPRDEDVYILAMRAGALVPFVASYDADFDNWYTFNGALEGCGGKFKPTHYMPLPDPPQIGSD